MGVLRGAISLRDLKSEESECFHFLQIPLTNPTRMIQCKQDCRSPKEKWKNLPIRMPGIEHCNWLFFSFCLRIQQSSRIRISVLLLSPSVWFLWDCIALHLITAPTQLNVNDHKREWMLCPRIVYPVAYSHNLQRRLLMSGPFFT